MFAEREIAPAMLTCAHTKGTTVDWDFFVVKYLLNGFKYEKLTQ